MKKHAKKIITVLLAVAMLIPTVAMIFSAADGDPVELAFNNLFIFEKWATNTLSTTAISDGTPNEGGELVTDIEAGSFTLTKTDMTKNELYTAFSMNSESAEGNADYYMMEVKPGTDYTFAYNLSGTCGVFTPYVFFYNNDGLYIADSLKNYTSPGTGINNFKFTTPSDAAYIQVRFTVGDNSTNTTATSVYATVEELAIYESSLADAFYDSKNLFSFEGWAGNSLSSAPADSTTGTITTNTNSETITFTTAATASTYLWSGNSVVNTATASTDYYSIDVEPSTSYTLTYSISDSTLPGPVHCQPFIIELDANGGVVTFYGYETPQYSNNQRPFTTQATTSSIQVVFAVINDGTAVSRTCKVSDIGVYETSVYSSLSNATYEEITGLPHRQVYTEGTGTYGENLTLPTPSNVPDGYVFSGWYTGENGTGKRITDDTTIDYVSYTVYPKYDIAVDSLSISKNPDKMTYTVGEKFNPTGLVLSASYTRTVEVQVGVDTDGDGEVDSTETKTEERETTISINSGYVYEPEYVSDTAGTQTITISYGGKSVTLDVTVIDSEQAVVTLNGTDTTVDWANNEYTFNYSGTSFNRYEMTYYSDAYVKGTITFEDGLYEDFFLEPSSNGTFASYVDKFVYTDVNGAIAGNSYTDVVSIKFTSLNKDFGKVELYSLNTISAPLPDDTVAYFINDNYKVGISLEYGGAVCYIEDLSDGPVAYTNSDGDTEVNFASMVPAGSTVLSTSVNLINTHDRGRYLQQSYYGTNEDPFVMGDYNGDPWRYNPVQGGNILGEASKVVDYRITEDGGIYIKTRPLDWGKWSDAAGEAYNAAQTDDLLDKELIYEDSYNTPSYMEAWYSFENKDLIRTDCRFVDYSGYPSALTDQELPAFYPIEPLNTLLYAKSNDEATAQPWTEDTTLTRESDLEFWGINYEHLLEEGTYDNDRYCVENWAAFMSDEDENSFGIGLYSPGVTDFTVGQFPSKYDPDVVTESNKLQTNDAHRHAVTSTPTSEDPTTYIAPVDKRLFESYSPTTYSFYVSTGNTQTISESFEEVASGEVDAEYAKSKVAVPETAYMQPTTDENYTLGKYYVNNKLDSGDYYNVYTVADSDAAMYFGLYVQNGASFKVNVTNVTNPDEDIVCGNADGTGNYENKSFTFEEFIEYDGALALYFADGGGLAPGEMATAKWEIEVTLADGTTETYTAYTVLYAPGRTVGAVAEGRWNGSSNNEISSWITGATGVDHSQRAPLSTFHGDIHDSGRFLYDPLVYDETVLSGIGSSENSHDYIYTDYPNEIGTANDADDYSDNAYVLQTATHDSDDSSSQSYLGLLAIDKSRYTNTDQIPNLEIGFDALRNGSSTKQSIQNYNTYYTLGTAESFSSTDLSATPSGWTSYSSYSELANSKTIPYRETVVPSYSVTDDMDGKYIHAVTRAICVNPLETTERYSIASTSVLISLTDKSALRDAVTDGYTKVEEDYTSATYPEFIEKLEDAATVLGDPTATQDEIDQATKDLENVTEELTEVYYALKYDNLFSAYEFSQKSGNMTMSNTGSVTYSDRTFTTVNDALASGGETYTRYGGDSSFYHVALSPNTEYVFEYDITTSEKGQVFMFFYNSSGGNSEAPANMSYKVNDGAWNAKSESNPWWGICTDSAGTYHYVIKFTTGATTTMAGFRFGNTTNNACTSTFSNIRLIDSARYYADVEYANTEAVYKQYASYGTLPTLTRPGYTFGGWQYEDGTTATAADLATAHKSIFSVWTVVNYTITYNANGGSVSPATQTYTVADSVTLPTPSRNGYTFANWKVTTADGSWVADTTYNAGAVLTDMYGNVTLTAQWSLNSFQAFFDTILDFSDWNTTSANSATISNVTSNGFTLTSNSDAGEGTSESPEFPVTPGKQYYVDIDFAGDNWDVYIFFRNESIGSTGIAFDDSTNRFSSNGTGNTTRTFTAPEGATKAVIRLDANGSSNSVTFSDIRVYEADTRAANVDVPYSSKEIKYGETFGTLPVPTREGYTFVGWYDGDNLITAETTVTQTSTVYLASKWVISDTALVSDTVVIDFATPIDITPLANDTIFNAESGTKALLGISSDGTSYASTLSGTYGTFTVSDNTVTYQPTAVVDGIETIYYHASLTADGVTTEVKSSITVAPASNVLYEETYIQPISADNRVDWTIAGTTLTVNQDSSTSNDVYGYDSNTSGYNKYAEYSNGSARQVTVTNTNRISENLSFSFAGTGFDLNGACGAKTGVMIVSIKNNDENTMVKSYIVDTYYGDSYGTLYQVPIVCARDLGYANYTVQIAASYLPTMSGAVNASQVQTQAVDSVDGMTVNTAPVADDAALRDALAEIGMEYVLDSETVEVVWFDDDSVLNGGKGADTPVEGVVETATLTSLLNVVDSARVYYPLNEDDSHYIESEKNAVYYNVITNLVNGDSLSAESMFAYVSGDANNAIITNYEKLGPKDELYLSESTTKAVAFTIENYANIKGSAKVMISLRAAYGTPTVKFGDAAQFEVKSNTEMYYDITDYIGEGGIVTIQNIPDADATKALLSVGTLKITSADVVAASLSADVDLATVRTMMLATAEDVEPNAPEVPEEPTTPEEPETPEEPTDSEEPANECWLIRFFRWVISIIVKVFDILKGFLAA